MNWVILFGLWIAGAFMLYAGFHINEESNKNINWRQFKGGWIFSLMPWWLVRLIFVLLGIGITLVGFGFLFNVILIM